MHYYLEDGKISCPCIDSNDARSYHSVSEMFFCSTCKIRRCTLCTLHNVTRKICLRCEKEYGMQDTHCYRCYICPKCDSDLESYPLLYKSKLGNNTGDVELVKSKNDKSKIVGKAVQFKCSNKDCNFKFKTKIETKPQSLQQIVQRNIKDMDDLRYESLLNYYDWCLNYQRILDKRQLTKWKTEIMKRFKSFEVAKILHDDSNIKELIKKENDMIEPIKDIELYEALFPLPKQLSSEMNNICPTCLNVIDMEKIISIPLVYVVPMVGYPSSNVKNLEEGSEIEIPILVSFINHSNYEVTVTILENNKVKSINHHVPDLIIPFSQEDNWKTVPTCLLSHVLKKKGDWKRELENRDPNTIMKLTYSNWLNESDDENCIVDQGINWITTLIMVKYKMDTNNKSSGKVDFVLNIAGDLNIQYHCNVLV